MLLSVKLMDVAYVSMRRVLQVNSSDPSGLAEVSD